jgi:hypothetical protein
MTGSGDEPQFPQYAPPEWSADAPRPGQPPPPPYPQAAYPQQHPQHTQPPPQPYQQPPWAAAYSQYPPYPPYPQPSYPGHRPVQHPQPGWTIGLAVTSFVLSLLLVLSVVALPMAIGALVGMRRTAARMQGLAIAAVVISSVTMTVAVPAAIFFAAGMDAERNEAGEVVEEGELDLFEARVGDCFDDDEEEMVETLWMIPCRDAHTAEVYAVPVLTGPYPGDSALERTAEQLCENEFGPYVGTDPDASSLDFGFYYPDRATWSGSSDRHVVCILADAGGDDLYGSVKGSGR